MTEPVGGRWRFPVLGGLATGAAFVLALVASAVLLFLNSYCTDSEVRSARHAIRQDLLVTWLLAASVPALTSVLAKRSGRSVWPWAIGVSLFVAVGVISALRAQPSYWCAF